MLDSRIFREENGKQLSGLMFPVIVHNYYYFLTQLVIYEDGMIDCWGLMDKTEFLQKLNSGWIRIDLPDNVDLYMGLSKIEVNSFTPEKDVNDFILEVDEAQLELAGMKSNRMIAIDLFKKYLLNDSEQNFSSLSKTFEKLPKHKKALFEYYEKDELYQLMINDFEKYTTDRRISILNDYFEDEWNEIDFNK